MIILRKLIISKKELFQEDAGEVSGGDSEWVKIDRIWQLFM